MASKIVKIEVSLAESMQSAAEFGVHMIARMREAGIPVIGVLGPIGVRYGTLRMHTEYSVLDGEHFVVEWSTKRGETDPGANFDNLFTGKPPTEE